MGTMGTGRAISSTQASYLASVEIRVKDALIAAHKMCLRQVRLRSHRDYGIAYSKVLFNARKILNDAGYGQLSKMLENLSIPRSTACFWIKKFEVSEGFKTLRVVPCEHCEETFAHAGEPIRRGQANIQKQYLVSSDGSRNGHTFLSY